MTRTIALATLLLCLTAMALTKNAHATEADNVKDFTITPQGSPELQNGSGSTNVAFMIDLGIPNNSGGEDPAPNVASQTYTFSTSSDGTFDKTRVGMPPGFTITASSQNSLTISKTESSPGKGDGDNAQAANLVYINVAYNIANSTAVTTRAVTLSGTVVFDDGSSKTASGTSTVTVDPAYAYDSRNLSGKELWDNFTPDMNCTPSFDNSVNDGVLYVTPGEQLRLGINQLVDDDRKRVTNGSWIAYDDPNASL